MPSVPLSTFIEFTVAQGTARVNAATLPSGDYDPRKDFYKLLRERTVRQLVEGWSEPAFRRSVHRLATLRKQKSFEACRAGLSSWAQGKELSARRAPNVTWAAAGLEVRVNPELRLSVGGRQFAAKLYFKVPELSAERSDNILCLLAETAPPGAEAAILDARRGELITAEQPDPDRDAPLISEAAAFAALLAVGQTNVDPLPAAAEHPPLLVAA